MKKFLHINLLLILFLSRLMAQNDYNTNLWLASQLSLKSNQKHSFTVDLGYRSHELFIQHSRTALARIVFERKINSNFVGIGFANFYHFNHEERNLSVELRPFLHYRTVFQNEKLKTSFWLRFREEARFNLKNNSLQFRSRIQVGVRKQLTQQNQLHVSIEQFFTPINEQFLYEQRYQLGISSQLKHINLVTFYQIQLQNTYQGLQHIIGLTIQKEQ
jgi:hypothetical protein